MTRLAWVLVVMTAFAETPAARFSVMKSKDFGPVKKTLERLVVEKGTKKKNHFCLLGQKLENGEKRAMVHWKEEQALITWDEPADKESTSRLANSRGYTDLRKDVVPTEADVRGSTHLVTRVWVDGVLRDCAKYGDQVTVKKPTNSEGKAR